MVVVTVVCVLFIIVNSVVINYCMHLAFCVYRFACLLWCSCYLNLFSAYVIVFCLLFGLCLYCLFCVCFYFLCVWFV